MTATMRNEEMELAHRASNGIEVSLIWSRGTNRVTVRVFDTRAEDGFELAVDRRSALDAYRHPFAYATPEQARQTSVLTERLGA